MKPEPMYLHYFTSERIFPFFIQYGHHDRDHKRHYHADFYELMIVMDGTAKQQILNEGMYLFSEKAFLIILRMSVICISVISCFNLLH